jgi:hypothetical protein
VTNKEILIKCNTALFASPATAEQLERCQETLENMGLPLIPQEYADFLRERNGFLDGGDIAFYGTERIKSKKSNFRFKDIVSANEYKFHINHFIERKKVLLGSKGNDLYVYNAAEECYEVLDVLDLDVYKRFDNFWDMFNGGV